MFDGGLSEGASHAHAFVSAQLAAEVGQRGVAGVTTAAGAHELRKQLRSVTDGLRPRRFELYVPDGAHANICYKGAAAVGNASEAKDRPCVDWPTTVELRKESTLQAGRKYSAGRVHCGLPMYACAFAWPLLSVALAILPCLC